MTKLLVLSLQVRFTITANRLINFLRHIPLIKRVIRPQLYGDYSLKLIFSGLGILFSLIRKILFRMFYIGFLVVFGLLTIQAAAFGGYQEFFSSLLYEHGFEFASFTAADLMQYILTVWFFFSFLGSFAGPAVAPPQNHDNDVAMINYLRADPALYARARVCLAATGDILLYLPYVLAAFIFAGIPLWCILPMLAMFIAFRLIGEMINLLFFRCTKRHLSNFPYTLLGYFVLAAAVYFPVYSGIIDWTGALTSPLIPVIAISAGFGAWLYIVKYKLHGELIRNKLGKMEITLGKIKEKNKRASMGLNYVDASKWHKSIDTQSLKTDKHKSKTGFAYLNAVFFDRHGKFFRNKILFRCAFLFAPLILTAVYLVYTAALGREPGSVNSDIPFHFAPLFFFVMYISSMGRVVTGTVFTNCDIHMLHYTYYRTKETTEASFKSRFAVILIYNLIIAACAAFSMLGTVYLIFGYMDYTGAVVFAVLLLLIGVLFAFNDLFLYYVIQPYDSAGYSKSMAYKVINFVIYIIAYVNFQLRLDIINYTIFIAVITVLYLGTGTFLLSKLAPKKFKLR